MNTTIAISFFSTCLALAACASSSSPSTEPTTGSTSSPARSASSPAAATADDVTGTWVFALDRSDVAAPLKKECEGDAHGDVMKAKSCYDAVAIQAVKEKVRFSKDASGHVVWRSFGVDGGKEEVFLEVPVELASDGPGHVLAKVSGPATGMQAEKFGKANINALRIEVVDAHTIAMTDPKKGRLVYTKE